MEPALPQSGSPRVLVADDDPMFLKLVKRILNGAGFSAELAEDGEVALQRLQEGGEWYAVVTDREMPRLDGYELARRVHESWPELPVLLTTARPQRLPPNIAVELDAYLPKPFKDSATFLSALKDAKDMRAVKTRRVKLEQSLRGLGADKPK